MFDTASISPVKGNAGEASLTISVIANETPDERKATIVLESGTSIANIVVTQKRKDISREVLLDFYKSTNGDGWKNNTNWCSDKPLSEWYGISTDQNGEVITINSSLRIR